MEIFPVVHGVWLANFGRWIFVERGIVWHAEVIAHHVANKSFTGTTSTRRCLSAQIVAQWVGGATLAPPARVPGPLANHVATVRHVPYTRAMASRSRTAIRAALLEFRKLREPSALIIHSSGRATRSAKLKR